MLFTAGDFEPFPVATERSETPPPELDPTPNSSLYWDRTYSVWITQNNLLISNRAPTMIQQSFADVTLVFSTSNLLSTTHNHVTTL